MILFIIFVALGLAAARWNVDSRQRIDSEGGQRWATLTFASHRA